MYYDILVKYSQRSSARLSEIVDFTSIITS